MSQQDQGSRLFGFLYLQWFLLLAWAEDGILSPMYCKWEFSKVNDMKRGTNSQISQRARTLSPLKEWCCIWFDNLDLSNKSCFCFLDGKKLQKLDFWFFIVSYLKITILPTMWWQVLGFNQIKISRHLQKCDESSLNLI